MFGARITIAKQNAIYGSKINNRRNDLQKNVAFNLSITVPCYSINLFLCAFVSFVSVDLIKWGINKTLYRKLTLN